MLRTQAHLMDSSPQRMASDRQYDNSEEEERERERGGNVENKEREGPGLPLDCRDIYEIGTQSSEFSPSFGLLVRAQERERDCDGDSGFVRFIYDICNKLIYLAPPDFFFF